MSHLSAGVLSMLCVERKQKGGFVIKGGFGECSLVPVLGTVVPFLLYLRSGFWYRRSAFCTLVPVWGVQEHLPKPPFWKPPFNLRTPECGKESPEKCALLLGKECKTDPSEPFSGDSHRVLQGAAQRGAQFYFIFSGQVTRPQLGPFFVLKFLRSRGLSSTVSKVRSDCKVLFEQKNGPLIAANGR